MNLKNFYLQKKGLIIFSVILVLILLSSHLRFYKLTKTYSEYDENFMITLHKSALQDREVSINLGPINKKFTIKLETLHNLEKSFLLPFYIAYGSTYSPGQYAILPLILNKEDNYETIVKKNRSISALASIFTLVLLLYLLYKIENKFTWLSALTMSIFGFSINSIMYAHHGGVYSTYGLTSLIGLILVYLSIENKITTYKALTINTFLLYFSYLNIFYLIIFFYIEFDKKNFKKFFFSFFLNKKKYLFVNLFFFIPILISFLLKNEHKYHRGESLPEIANFFNFISFFEKLIIQFYYSIKSLFSVFIPYTSGIFFLIVFCLLIISIINSLIKRKNSTKKKMLIVCLIYFLQWVILYCFGLIPLDQTRHILTFFPIILVIFYISFEYLSVSKTIYLFLILSLVPFSYFNAKKTVENKISLYDLNYLNEQEESLILTYDSLQPLLFFENKNKKVYFTQLEQFKENYQKIKITNRFLVVGHHKPFSKVEDRFKSNFPDIYDNYNIQVLIERKTKENYFYNNYKHSDNSNGFYVYRFIKK